MSETISRDAAINELERAKVRVNHSVERAIGRGIIEILDDVEKSIKALPPAELHWIPCSERLPEKTQLCLVTEKTVIGLETCTRCFNKRDDGGFWSGWGHTDVIAWMPLPEPYKGVTE